MLKPWIYRPLWWSGPNAGAAATLCAAVLLVGCPLLVLAVWAGGQLRDGWLGRRAAPAEAAGESVAEEGPEEGTEDAETPLLEG